MGWLTLMPLAPELLLTCLWKRDVAITVRNDFPLSPLKTGIWAPAKGRSRSW